MCSPSLLPLTQEGSWFFFTGCIECLPFAFTPEVEHEAELGAVIQRLLPFSLVHGEFSVQLERFFMPVMNILQENNSTLSNQSHRFTHYVEMFPFFSLSPSVMWLVFFPSPQNLSKNTCEEKLYYWWCIGRIILQASRFSPHLKLSLKWAQLFSDCSKLRSLGNFTCGRGLEYLCRKRRQRGKQRWRDGMRGCDEHSEQGESRMRERLGKRK